MLMMEFLTFEQTQMVHMWLALALTFVTLVAFAMEKQPIEVTALCVIVFMLVFYALFPLPDANGNNILDTVKILSGFANPSLIAVLSLLVIGQAMVQTDALMPITAILVKLSKISAFLAVGLTLFGVLLISGILNNTPLVIMFIPVMQTMAHRIGWSTSRIMMPLSFAAILGGMVTLIGSSTNLLVSSTLQELGEPAMGFFDFALPGLGMGIIAMVYVLFILPRLLPDRASMAEEIMAHDGKEFIAEILITEDSPLIGMRSDKNMLPQMEDVTVRLVQRGGMVILPPFDNYTTRAGDVLIVAATRQALTELLSATKGFFLAEEGEGKSKTGDTESATITLAPGATPEKVEEQTDEASDKKDDAEHVLTELMVAPASRLIDQTLDQAGFARRYNCRVIGIQRRARMVRGGVGDIRLNAGDILLVIGDREDIRSALARNSDLIRLAWSTREVPKRERAPIAFAIFILTVGLAAADFLPIAVTAPTGATLMILAKCLNLRQAVRALDRKIVLLVTAALALSAAMDKSGAAHYIAMAIFNAIPDPSPMMAASVMFLIVAIATNMLSNNACAVIFTPIAFGLANQFGISPTVMAITVIFAANCSFASPIGYQTNLMVMGPGHYRFKDFLRGGAPLILILWLAFMVIFPMAFEEMVWTTQSAAAAIASGG